MNGQTGFYFIAQGRQIRFSEEKPDVLFRLMSRVRGEIPCSYILYERFNLLNGILVFNQLKPLEIGLRNQFYALLVYIVYEKNPTRIHI